MMETGGKMIDIYIFGLGEGKRYLDRCLLNEVNIIGYIDNFKAKQINGLDGIPVISQNEIQKNFDYIVVTLMEYEDVRDSLINDGIEKNKIISFFDFSHALNEENWMLIDSYKWRMELMWKHYINVVKPLVENIGYEIYADAETMKRECPKIMDAESTLDILKKERKSLARFGDNEFGLMCGCVRTGYQELDKKLENRLKEALESQVENLLIAIANNYGSLEMYTDAAARDIRMYMTKTVRKEHMKLLDSNRQYYDAYLSRPYMIYRDKENAEKRFEKVRAIWDGEDVLVIEGEHTRFGVGNDLLENARSIQRIIVPDRNAFEKYEEIKNAAYEYGKGKLLLSVLGPTATVLAYDLAKEGYWIIDIGQLDTEYGWFLEKVEKRCGLKYKRVSEVGMHGQLEIDIFDENMQSYFNEIVGKIL